MTFLFRETRYIDNIPRGVPDLEMPYRDGQAIKKKIDPLYFLVRTAWKRSEIVQVVKLFNGEASRDYIRELTLLWYSRIYFCKVCIRPKKPKNDSQHWIEIYRRIVIVESSMNVSSQKDCQAAYYWFFPTILHRKSNHQLCVKDFIEEGLDGSLTLLTHAPDNP